MKMQIVTVYVPDAYLLALEALARDVGKYDSRSAAIREALNRFVDQEIAHAEAIAQLGALQVRVE